MKMDCNGFGLVCGIFRLPERVFHTKMVHFCPILLCLILPRGNLLCEKESKPKLKFQAA